MTAAQPPYPDEPPPPQRGLTSEERGRDVSEAQAEAEEETGPFKRYLSLANPKFVWSMADGYPVGIKQFLQFCLILVYPAFLFFALAGAVVHGLFYITVYPVLWLLFWPVRAYQKKNNPEEYAANREKYKNKKWYET